MFLTHSSTSLKTQTLDRPSAWPAFRVCSIHWTIYKDTKLPNKLTDLKRKKLVIGRRWREITLQITIVFTESFWCALLGLGLRRPFMMRRGSSCRHFFQSISWSTGVHVRSDCTTLAMIVAISTKSTRWTIPTVSGPTSMRTIFTTRAIAVFVTVLVAMALWVVVVFRIVSVEYEAATARQFFRAAMIIIVRMPMFAIALGASDANATILLTIVRYIENVTANTNWRSMNTLEYSLTWPCSCIETIALTIVNIGSPPSPQRWQLVIITAQSKNWWMPAKCQVKGTKKLGKSNC